MGLLPPVDPALVHPVGALAFQRRPRPLGGELPADELYGAGVDVEGVGDGGGGPTRAALPVVGLEEDGGAGEHPGRGDAGTDKAA